MTIAEIDDYEVAVNPAGEMLFLLPPLEGDCENPCLYYDGGEHAILMRAPENFVLLKHIPEALRVRLGFTSRVSVKEVRDDGTAMTSYAASVHFAHDIPALRGTA